ncbi:DUF488 domain-containing protein [Cyclobacterium amurskyense]|uniref:DUF488 domain-containing protein n=1 Tax=Cyclobacterium amurskyense TaxID=320787 RepID=UPI001F0B2846|nr:DUF488 domain-containing protein [Cyclobacterium amurskyense]
MGLIELLGGEVEELRLQKLLFLYAKKKTQSEYDFIPYKYGCYSYSAKADLNTMVKKGFLSETENKYCIEDKSNYFQKLKPADAKLLKEVVWDYGQMSRNALIKHTYLNFPFYAINSTIANEVLPGSLYDRVKEAIPNDEEITLFTIGYEGISLEKYLQKLIRNNVKLLVDVRKNPLSMKFGFSKTLLKRFCNSLNIEYFHIPEVGISSDKRQQLESQTDYDNLFAEYRKTTLSETKKAQQEILKLLMQYKRIALTCFEAEPCQCHRSHLAEFISKSPDFKYSLRHL